ncbi:MAG: type II toxin-antitoxin system VapC family toxin [Caldilineaceae bacterium]
MNYLIDTDWVIEYLKGRKTTVEMITQHAADGLAVSLITYGEIYEGILLGRDPKRHEQGFLTFLRTPVVVLSPNKLVMKRFAQIRGQLRQAGQLIGDFDLVIAATALHYNLTLLTHNTRHLSRIPDLKLLT